MLSKFEEIDVLERLDETHGGTTKIVVGKHQQRLVVCKSIKKSSFKDQKSIEHIKNEKQALVHFTNNKSKGINKLITTFQDEQELHIVLEPVKGLPLHKLLQMAGPLNASFTFLVVSQIGLILQQFHQNGYIYRDIKASNFMIDQEGRVTMIDLGHAKKIDRDRTYTICGTVHSIPPEVYEEKGYSYEFDYYGFGILIYELLTAKAPFGYGNTNPNIIEQMKAGISFQQIQLIQCQITRDLISKLLSPSQSRLGTKKGFEQILQHDYFNVPQFCTAKDIYDGQESIDTEDPRYENYLSQISDFGIQDYKFEEVPPSDPFYKFYE